jgi:uncharacterized protein
MFRGMRRWKQSVPVEECRKILMEERRGAFSVLGDNGYPYTIPINFYYDDNDHCIYFHGAKEGHKVDAIKRCDKVCFTTWNTGYQDEGCWAWNVSSVIVFGRARLVENREMAEDRVRKLAMKYYPTMEEVEKGLDASMDRLLLFAIDIEHMTGKLVNER